MKNQRKAGLLFLIMMIATLGIAQQNGAQMCSKRKSMSNYLPTLKSPNSPRHSFDVIHYLLTIKAIRPRTKSLL
jgi:hypothetical protein